MTGASVDFKALEKLSPDLQGLLEAELAVGNSVASTGWWLYENVEILVCMAEPFRIKNEGLSPSVEYEERRDPWTANGTICDYSAQVEVNEGGGRVSALHILRAIRAGSSKVSQRPEKRSTMKPAKD